MIEFRRAINSEAQMFTIVVLVRVLVWLFASRGSTAICMYDWEVAMVRYCERCACLCVQYANVLLVTWRLRHSVCYVLNGVALVI